MSKCIHDNELSECMFDFCVIEVLRKENAMLNAANGKMSTIIEAAKSWYELNQRFYRRDPNVLGAMVYEAQCKLGDVLAGESND